MRYIVKIHEFEYQTEATLVTFLVHPLLKEKIKELEAMLQSDKYIADINVRVQDLEVFNSSTFSKVRATTTQACEGEENELSEAYYQDKYLKKIHNVSGVLTIDSKGMYINIYEKPYWGEEINYTSNRFTL